MTSMHSDTSAEELPLNNVFTKLLNEESMQDVSLQGIDGTVIKANRCILAARSDIFHKMLYGKFSEASKPIIEVGYSGSILQAVVQYIYTNHPDFFKHDSLKAVQVKSIADLSNAASYFNLPRLGERTKDFACAVLHKDLSLSCDFLLEFGSAGPEAPVRDVALDIIHTDPATILDCPTLPQLGISVMKEILGTWKGSQDELLFFQILEQWAKGSNDFNDESSEVSELLAFIELEKVSPQNLHATVANSGLVSSTKLMEAYRSQALSAAEKHGTSFDNSGPCHTADTSKTEIDFLVCFTTKNGHEYQWKIKVPQDSLLDKILSVQLYCKSWKGELWNKYLMFDGLGRVASVCGGLTAWESGDGPRFAAGDEIAVTQKFTKGTNDGGVLKASVNNGYAHEIFSNVRNNIERGSECVLVPTIDIWYTNVSVYTG